MHYLYWYYGQLAGLCGDWNRIYIGITSRTLVERDREHVYQDWWWRQFSKHLRISKVFETRREAMAAEEEAIYKYQPFGNDIHNQRFTQSDRGIYLRKINLFLPEKPKLITQHGKLWTPEMIDQLEPRTYNYTLRDSGCKYLALQVQCYKGKKNTKQWILQNTAVSWKKISLGLVDTTNREDSIDMPKKGQLLTPTEARRLAQSKYFRNSV